jgi:phosphatidylglycerophosphate synthase
MTSPTSRMPAPASPADAGPGAGSAAPTKPREVEELPDEYIHRPLARWLVAVLVRTPITPNQVTFISGLLGVLAGVSIAFGVHEPRLRLLAGGLLFLSVVFDCCDGQLARARGISSTTGAILDGVADYFVGVAIGLGATWFTVQTLGSPWYWLLGLAGTASSAAQSAMFDHAKTRYIARVAGGYREREEDVDRVSRDRRLAWSEGRYRDALLYRVYEGYSRAQHAALHIPPVTDPAAYRAANAGRMRSWTVLGIGTHLAFAYLCLIAACWWAAATAVYFAVCATALNVVLALMMGFEKRQVRP